MRALILAALLALGAVFGPGARAEPRHGFDHDRHAAALDQGGTAAIACAQCHAFRGGELAGKPRHATCLGACHGPLPAVATGKLLVIPAPQRKVCETCHAATTLAAPVPAARQGYAADAPPSRVAADFSLGFGHQAHGAVGCATCHAAPDAKRAAPPHRRCASCHDGKPTKGFAMTDCRGCHTRAADAPERVQLRAAQILVDAAFSHGSHAARGPAGRACATCHPGIATTNARTLPRPPMDACATSGCHDAKAAFGVTTACTKCHRDPPSAIFAVARPSTRFSHELPAHAGANIPCIGCHAVARSGEVQVAGHAACAACHAADFGARKPKICGACHNGTEPWRPLVADRLPAERTEFGASLDHGGAGHAKLACAACHALTTATVQLRPARGHGACATSGCHARAGGPAPRLVDCERCHELGLADRRDATRRAVTWSVRARFDHAPHAMRGGASLPCQTCHVDLTAKRVMDLAAPAKATCAPCHDGGTAFKLTGTTCTRCHPGPTK